MKKTKFIAAGMACAATFALFAASDRIDVYNHAGKFTSFMVDDIKEMTVGKAEGQEGYSTLNITTAQGTAAQTLDDVKEIQYSPVEKYKAHDLVITSDPHAFVRLLDWRNNTDVYGEAQIDPTKPADWRGCWADGNPHFLIDTEKGFTSDVAIIGLYTGKVYSDNPNFIFWSTKENNLLGIDSYSFDMPYEPVEIKSSSEELDTYAGAPFLGTYKGYILVPGEKRISNSPATLSVEFKANTTYVITSTDENEYDIIDLYKWNQEKNTVSYIPYEGGLRNPYEVDIWYGLTGSFTGDGVLYATMHNIVEDKPDNNVKYFAINKDADVTVAVADQYNRYALVQCIAAGENARYYFYNEGLVNPAEVTMQFVSGDNIGKNCVAFCISNNEKVFKYEYTEGGEPVYTFRGQEYGTYKASDAGNGDLFVDGFGTCKLGDKEGTYEINDGVATVKVNGNTYMYVLDRGTYTYKEVASDEWDGASSYRLTTATGKYGNEPEAAIHTISVDFDKDLRGNDNPGYVAISMGFASNGGLRTSGGVADICKYIYDAESKTVTLTNVTMGTSATTSGRRNLTLILSDDKQSMWIDNSTEDRVYGLGHDGSYWLTGEVNTLLAPVVPPAVDLFDKYTGTATLNPEGLSLTMSCNVTLTFDAENQKASFNVSDGMNTYIDMPEAEYFMTGYTLYIKNVTVSVKGEGGYEDVIRDFKFTVSEDATVLTSEEKFTKYLNQYSTVNINFAGSEFKYKAPVVTPDPGKDITLASLYTGAPTGTAMGSQLATETTLAIDAENKTATLTVMVSQFNQTALKTTATYELNGNTLTLKDADVYTNVGGIAVNPSKADIVFTVSNDGKTLTCSQTVTGSLMNSPFDIDMSSAELIGEIAEVPAIQLATLYTGAPQGSYMNSPMPTEASLAIDAENGKATLTIKAFNTPAINTTAAYELSGNTLTLKDADVYTNVGGIAANPSKADIVFTVSNDGKTLTCSQTVTGSLMNSPFDIDMSSSEFKAAE